MKEKLDTRGTDWALEHYRNASGDYISGTLGAHAERIRAGKSSSPRRDTCAYIYHVHKGSGESEIITANGEKTKVCWQLNDTFAVPAWSQIFHTANMEVDAYFFVLSDRPLLETLNMYFTDKAS
jgi:gentisate 1,2-dioxygenase